MSKPANGGGRPTRGYRLKDGTKVPSVTTIIGRFKESGGLVHWAWQLGIDGKDYKKESKNAADAGSIAHELIDADITGRDPVIQTAEELNMDEATYALTLQRANKSFAAFRTWRRSVDLDVFATEVPFVSEANKFGGCIDAMARIGGELAVFDWKTSNRIYQDYIIQVAAYRQLWEENHPGDVVDAIHLLRVGKEFGDFHHHSWPLDVLDTAWKAFKLQRELYELDETLKRAAA